MAGADRDELAHLRPSAMSAFAPLLEYERTHLGHYEIDALDPNVWSGRALQEDFVDLSDVRSCINVSGLSLERIAPGHHGYQRACDLITG
jgi:hypothetical protein